ALGVSAARAAVTARRGGFRGRAGLAGAALVAGSWAGLAEVRRRGVASAQPMRDALDQALGSGFRDDLMRPGAPGPTPDRELGPVKMFRVRSEYVAEKSGIPYGPHGAANLLDIWRHKDLPRDGKAPVIVQLPGGAWITGSRTGQAYPLLSHLAAHGWVCVSISYRLGPNHTWPAHIVDVKKALAWVKDNIADHGGDPDFVAITGGSAGGHLASLAALTSDDPSWQPGFESADTSVQAAVPMYGRYDWASHEGAGRDGLVWMLEHAVVKKSYDHHRDVYRAASPVTHARADAPPFFVMHGSHDSIIPVEEARAFVRRMRSVGASPFAYAELPGAQHAFDIFGSPRAQHAARAIEDFLDHVWTQHQRGR
ncbi:MAG: alpha/beta hydrolase, partial [Aeromicrobium sp.]|nr:alpha/beta hydrolase [Aeromicrobium sp.]